MSRLRVICNSKWCFYVLLLILCIFLVCMTNSYDYDLYARLIVGENFIEQGVFNYKDYLSYTPTHLWYDHEWGSSLVFYLFLKYFGAFGLILIQAILMFFTGFFILKTQKIQEHAYPVSLAFMTIFMILYIHQNPAVVRCHMFSFMFFAMFIYFLEKARRFDSKIIWSIPILIVIWNNLHGGVVAGLGLLAIYTAGEFLSRRRCLKYLAVLFVSVPLLAINPYGFDYFNFLISANTMQRTYVTEWWNVFHKRHCAYYYPMFAVIIFTLLLTVVNFIRKHKLSFTKVLLLIITAYLGIIHVKLLSLPIIVIAGLFYNDIVRFIDKKSFRLLEKIAFISIIICAFCIPLTDPRLPKTDIIKFPVKEVEFLRINNINGNLLTEFGYGSYVAYKRYPKNLVYMDGRYEEVYYNREFENLYHYEMADKGWEKFLDDYGTEILMPVKSIKIYPELEKSSEWVKIYEGDVCGIFVKKDKVLKNYEQPSEYLRYYQIKEFFNEGYFGKNKQIQKVTK